MYNIFLYMYVTTASCVLELISSDLEQEFIEVELYLTTHVCL